MSLWKKCMAKTIVAIIIFFSTFFYLCSPVIDQIDFGLIYIFLLPCVSSLNSSHEKNMINICLSRIWIQFANIRDIHTHKTNECWWNQNWWTRKNHVCLHSEWVSEWVSKRRKKNLKRSGNISHFLSLFFYDGSKKKSFLNQIEM